MFYETFADVPMVHMSSWFDAYTRTATDNYLALSRSKRGPVFLILGPWTHGDRCLTFVGDVDFGSVATLEGNLADDYLALRLRWFDRWVKDIPNGAEADPRVRYFRMGGGSGRKNEAGRLQHGGEWLSAVDWPPTDARTFQLHLRADGRLSEEPPQGDDSALVYAYDPRHPVPSIGGTITSGEPVMRGGAFDQVEDPTVLRLFSALPAPGLASGCPGVRTELLTEDLEITGPVSACLWISSDCPDTDFTIKLIDVYPPNGDYPHGLRDEPDGRHPSRPLPGFLGATHPDGPGSTL